ncbi:MAG: site-2 protease family protein [Phycisphaerales bacterium]
MTFTTLFNIGIIILGFGLLIFFHELGHFIAAKWAGIRAQSFAIGMGPRLLSYRKGVGLALGSTDPATIQKTGKKGNDLSDEELNSFGVSETEYSLRLLPLGGFVGMLGQEDGNPNAVSAEPRSYSSAPIGKRMVVVSAGVIMNLLVAVVFFVWAFMVGVEFEAPIVGGTDPSMPAASAIALNANQYGIAEPGLQLGDVVLSVDGKDTETFGDIAIAAAMAAPETPVALKVRRDNIKGEPAVLDFMIAPVDNQGLLSLGILPARSTVLNGKQLEIVEDTLGLTGLADAGVEPHMQLVDVNNTPITTWQEFDAIARASNGQPLATRWADPGQPERPLISAPLQVRLQLPNLFHAAPDAIDVVSVDAGLFGLSPLVRVAALSPDSPNRTVLRPGDVIFSLGPIDGPRFSDISGYATTHPGETVAAVILRGRDQMNVSLTIDSKGKLGIFRDQADDLPYTAKPIEATTQLRRSAEEARIEHPTPVAGSKIPGGARLVRVNDVSIQNWTEFRRELREATRLALAAETGTSVNMIYQSGDAEPQQATLALSLDDIRTLHNLGWTTALSDDLFKPISIIISADGNPLTALAMGIDRTKMFAANVYLTLVRLFQRTVSVDQLRGPVGIVHVGTIIADKGFMYIVYFLALISVNLAVINFLPLPIVDGGLFLFLIYEKFKGRPPSVAFQNAVTLLGLGLIILVFVVVTYNDIARLIVG